MFYNQHSSSSLKYQCTLNVIRVRVNIYIFFDEGCVLTEDKTNWVKNDNDSLDI